MNRNVNNDFTMNPPFSWQVRPWWRSQKSSWKLTRLSFRGECVFLIYRNIINEGFTNMVTLPDSDDFDCVTCTCIADVDWDGRNEVILGTYGQVMKRIWFEAVKS